MKKSTALLFILVCVLALSGCSNKTNATGQIKELNIILDGIEEWTDDNTVNRFEYYYDGEFSFSNTDYIYYFSYELNLIYYDHFIGDITSEQMQYIKNLSKL